MPDTSPPVRTLRGLRHLGTNELDAEVQGILRGRERNLPVRLSANAAVTLASWWQAPSGVGKELAALASGAPVGRDALLEDVQATIREAEEKGPADSTEDHERDLRALGLLREWVESHP